MTRRAEADPLAFEGMENVEGGVAAVAEFREVCGALGQIAGRGNLSITEHPVLSRLPLTAALSAMPLSLSPVASGVRLGQGHPLGSLPGPPLPT